MNPTQSDTTDPRRVHRADTPEADASLQAAINEPIALQAHDPDWAVLYALESERLRALRPDVFTDLQHIGSTAVAGLPAKPVIDILAGVASMEVARSLAPWLGSIGYTTSPEFNATLVDRQWFMRWKDGHRTHHLHVVVYAEAAWRIHVGFRDALRANAETRARYAALKVALAAKHGHDREAYTEGKAEFVRAVCDTI